MNRIKMGTALFSVSLLSAVMIGLPGTTFAKGHVASERTVRHAATVSTVKAKAAQKKTPAQQAFVAAVKQANTDYKTSRQSAITARKAAMKSATTKEERKSILEKFKSDMTAARNTMKDAVKSALATLKASK